jgi:hypothetical protein
MWPFEFGQDLQLDFKADNVFSPIRCRHARDFHGHREFGGTPDAVF